MLVAVNALAATRGGAVTLLEPFLDALRRLEPEWQLNLYVSRPDLALSLEGVTTIVVRTGGWRRAWLELVGLERRARREGADVMLNLLNSGSLTPTLPSITWQRNALYFDRTWLEGQRLRGRLEAWLRRNVALLACRASTVTVAPSQAMASYVRDWRLGRSLRVEVIPHGVDVEHFATTRQQRSDDVFTIGLMGHAAAHRGLATAVHVLAEVRKHGVDARLVLTVPRHASPAFQGAVDDAARTAALLELSDHVVFGGAVDDAAAWYRGVDLLLVPSECESFCFPLVEGLAAGVPVVTSGLPALREVAGGLALHGRTHVEMAARVLEVHGEGAAQREHRAERGRRRSRDFSWTETATRVRALAVETLDAAGLRPPPGTDAWRRGATDRPSAP